MQPVAGYIFRSAFDRLLRPEQTARNAEGAAVALSRGVRARQNIERDVALISEEHSRGLSTG